MWFDTLNANQAIWLRFKKPINKQAGFWKRQSKPKILRARGRLWRLRHDSRPTGSGLHPAVNERHGHWLSLTFRSPFFWAATLILFLLFVEISFCADGKNELTIKNHNINIRFSIKTHTRPIPFWKCSVSSMRPKLSCIRLLSRCWTEVRS